MRPVTTPWAFPIVARCKSPRGGSSLGSGLERTWHTLAQADSVRRPHLPKIRPIDAPVRLLHRGRSMSLAHVLRGCLAAGLVVLSAIGCSEVRPQTCWDDADCPSEQRCSHTGELQQPIPFNPCATVIGCTDSSTCATDAVCAPYAGTGPAWACPPRVCVPRCLPGSCQQGQVCKESGLCELEDCDKDGAPACPAHYECNPAAAVAPLLPLSGSGVG